MTFNVDEAKSNLSRLLEIVEQGEEVIIARHGVPVAELVTVPAGKRRLGTIGSDQGRKGWDADRTDREAENEFGT